MKTKVVIWIAAAVIVGLIVIQQIAIRIQLNSRKDVTNYELLQSINSLRTKVGSLKDHQDNLQSIVDTNKVKVIEIEKRYETIRDHIITQSVDSDCITFANYISNYQRLSSGNNSTTAKDN